MSSYTQLHVHLITAVKYRRALLLPPWRDEMLRYQTGHLQNKKQKVLAINAMPDHLHILIGKHPSTAESNLMRDLKSDTSEWINKRGFTEVPFHWQDGYAAFACTKNILPTVIAYIRNQEAHHRKMKFREEIIGMLTERDIPFDSQYLFHDPM
ncbi:IS200/IS605 family transposase [Flaviaesturariibacter aridisoli]|uniref:IS200/IS605 family transposase n=1 Tax=Flaviaesturariibacter aridisoli TaxID=2545761 RepID=A0A4R4E3R7_9BACT|nr:IS200/IS605 family transposase [Flaviaesturariibacter aridisoli]TCZ72246.1 IS200/IS605 family transposase [Flaviaesturariibacter aridisoli]